MADEQVTSQVEVNLEKLQVYGAIAPPPFASYVNACQKCDYSLKGLPDQGKCPECGDAYDRGDWIVQQATILSRWTLGFHILFWAIYLYRGTEIIMKGYAFGWPLLLITMFWIAGTLRKHFSRPNRAVISDRTLHFYSRKGLIRETSLEEVTRVHLSGTNGLMYLEKGDQSESILGYRFWGNWKRAEAFVDAIRERLKHRR